MHPFDGDIVIVRDVSALIPDLRGNHWNAFAVDVLVTRAAFEWSVASVGIEPRSLFLCGAVYVRGDRVEAMNGFVAGLATQTNMTL